MNTKRKALPAVVCAAIVLALTASMVFAAYYGKGNFKDVFVNRKNCFTSDLLASVANEDAVAKSVFQLANENVINIYNYDLSSGEYNAFDMTFSLYAWLERDSADAETEYYDITVNGRQLRLTTADHTEPIFKDIPLAGNVASQCIITVGFNPQVNLSNYPKLYLYAIPTQPGYMTPKRLGGCITPTDSLGFSARGQFDILTDDLEDHAAFPYEVIMSGRLEKSGNLKIMWSPANLTLMTGNESLPDSIQVQTEGQQQYILIPLAEDYYNRLTFLRVQDVAAGVTNPWETDTIDRKTLDSFVTTEIVYDGT